MKYKNGENMLIIEKNENIKVKITDKVGNSEVFNEVKDAADVLGVTKSYVYQAIRKGFKISGCEVSRV